MYIEFAHCLFEQSGTFKREFEKLGVSAKDYDIRNDFGETDVVCDLFAQIENAYHNLRSIFDGMSPAKDVIVAFFPCTYFCANNQMFFEGTNYAWRNLSQTEILDRILLRADERHRNYILLLKLVTICVRRQLRLIIENPYNAHHYLRFNFPIKPAVIDMNRRTSGDFFKKPTQYLFVNCVPAGKKSVLLDKPFKYINNQKMVDRSMISADYAHNFICDNILGIDSGYTMPTLFD